MRTSNIPTSLFLSASLLVPAALAQNSTNNTTPSCATSTKVDAKVNSTGQHEFTWNNSYAPNDPWYISVLVGPDPTSPEDFAANTYISVPEDVPDDTKICIYQFSNINATLAGGENSCNGAISATCVDFLSNALNQSNGPNCPDHSSQQNAYKEACPMLEGSSARSSRYIDVTKDTCAITDVPEVQIPDRYNTFGAVQYRYGPYEDINQHSNPEQTYNLLTRQAVPLVLLGSFVDSQSRKLQTSTEVICVVANNTVEGSRTAKEEEPWKSAAVQLKARRLGWVAVGVTVAVVLAF